jgi:NADP-dependent 3-hydroxy acid dehydrogenase YdfG
VAPSRTILVTGCSSGIGAATVRRLASAGHTVYATARRVESLSALAAENVTPMALDVTDDDSMVAAVKQITAERGGIDVLINNAGFGLAGTIEEMPLATVRDQFEVNVFGLLRLTQLVLPGMRERRSGLVVNVSSILGRFAVPGSGHYDATKHAVEALSDALRLEVARFGVRVVLVQPGPVRTAFATTAVATMPKGETPSGYGDFDARVTAWYASVYGGAKPNLAGRFAVESDDVAKTIAKAVAAGRPGARYPVGLLAHGLFMLRRMLPDRLFDGFVRNQFPIP